MSDDQTQNSGGGAGTVVTDKNKTAEQYIAEAEKQYIIPKLVRDEFPDLVKLTYETESMNQEEREYWMQILPIMSKEQIVKFRDILVNEKEQLEKLDQDYQNAVASSPMASTFNEEEMKEKMHKLKQQEKNYEEDEDSKEAAILDQLENL